MRDAMVSAKNLAKRIAERQEFLEEVIRFVVSTLERSGRVIDREVHDWYTETTRKLNNLKGFSLYHYGSYSMFGGEDIKVWYHPRRGKATEADLVLEVQWWDIKKLEVKSFSESKSWQKSLKNLMKNQEKLRLVLEGRREKEKQQEVGRQKLKEKQERLQRSEAAATEDAKRLKLV